MLGYCQSLRRSWSDRTVAPKRALSTLIFADGCRSKNWLRRSKPHLEVGASQSTCLLMIREKPPQRWLLCHLLKHQQRPSRFQKPAKEPRCYGPELCLLGGLLRAYDTDHDQQ